MSQPTKTILICAMIAVPAALAWAGTADAGPRKRLSLDALPSYGLNGTSEDADSVYKSYGAYARKLTSGDSAKTVGDAIDAASDYLGVDLRDVDLD